MIVMKFGGSSLATAEKLKHSAGLIRREIERSPVVVVSAIGSTTNWLISASKGAVKGEADIAAVRSFHYELVDELGLSRAVVEPLLEQLFRLLEGVVILRELTPRTLDLIMSFGERLSTRVLAALLTKQGTTAQAVDAYTIGLATDDRHGCATPQPGIYPAISASLEAVVGVPVVTGFLGLSDDGSITTLGRSGSDYTASIVGAAIRAEEIQIWTDVDGVMTCDPSLDHRARNLKLLSFEEATELAYYGAKVLHPSTLVPAIETGVPVLVRNTVRPDVRGTMIVADPVRGDRLAKSVAYKEDVCLIHLVSSRLMSAAQLLTSALEALQNRGIAVHMAATSESTVSLVTQSNCDAQDIKRAADDLASLAKVTVEREKAIICVVGEELRGEVGVLSRIFGVLDGRGIRAKMASLSGSEINVGLLVDNTEIEAAVRALHGLILGDEGLNEVALAHG